MLIRMFVFWLGRVGVLTAGILALLRDLLPRELAIGVAVVAAILLSSALSLLLGATKSRRDAKLIERSLAGPAPQDGERAAFVGTLRIDGRPLRAPFSGAECALYSYDITHQELTGQSTSTSRSSTRTVTDFSGLALAAAKIETRRGSFKLLSFPFVEGFPAGLRENQAERDNAEAYLRDTRFEKMGALGSALGAIGDYDGAVSRSDGPFRCDWEGAGRRGVDKVALSEVFVPVDADAVAVGVFDGRRGGIRSAGGANELRLLAGSAEAVRARLEKSHGSRLRTATFIAVPTIAILAVLFAAPRWVIAHVPGSQAIRDAQGYRLAEALRNDDVPAIERLSRAFDPNMPVDGDLLPLMMVHGAAAARVLLAAGASANGHRRQGQSVLMELVQNGSPELVRVLLDAGAKPNEVHPAWNKTPVSFAREANNIPVVEALLDAGATDAVIEQNGGEPLHDDSAPVRAIVAYVNAHEKPGDPDHWAHSGVMTKEHVRVTLEGVRADGQTVLRNLTLVGGAGQWQVDSDDWR